MPGAPTLNHPLPGLTPYVHSQKVCLAPGITAWPRPLFSALIETFPTVSCRPLSRLTCLLLVSIPSTGQLVSLVLADPWDNLGPRSP